jgi:hypothetical protein
MMTVLVSLVGVDVTPVAAPLKVVVLPEINIVVGIPAPPPDEELLSYRYDRET